MATHGGMVRIWLLALSAQQAAKAATPAMAAMITPQAGHLHQELALQNIQAVMVGVEAMVVEAAAVVRAQTALGILVVMQMGALGEQAVQVARDQAAQVALAEETAQADRQAAQVQS